MICKKCYLPGSAITPTDEATLSPKDLDIAKPGTWFSFNHTRGGPINSPVSSSLNGSIRPPFS